MEGRGSIRELTLCLPHAWGRNSTPRSSGEGKEGTTGANTWCTIWQMTHILALPHDASSLRTNDGWIHFQLYALHFTPSILYFFLATPCEGRLPSPLPSHVDP